MASINAEPYAIHEFRDATKAMQQFGYTFGCSRCRQRRELAGHKIIDGKKVCRICIEAEKGEEK